MGRVYLVAVFVLVGRLRALTPQRISRLPSNLKAESGRFAKAAFCNFWPLGNFEPKPSTSGFGPVWLAPVVPRYSRGDCLGVGTAPADIALAADPSEGANQVHARVDAGGHAVMAIRSACASRTAERRTAKTAPSAKTRQQSTSPERTDGG